MIRPCPDCGGVGGVDWTDDGVGWVQGDPCPTCVDMPTVECPSCDGTGSHVAGTLSLACETCRGAGWFKPDPSTVMRWSFDHNSPVRYVVGKGWECLSCGHSVCVDSWRWIPAITDADALEEVTP